MLDIFDQKGFEITAMKYSDIKAGTLPGTFKIGAIDNVPDISAAGTGDASVWFLGPRAENQALLNGLIEEALNHIYRFRGDYLPGDPAAITPAIKSSLSYQRSVETMNAAYRELLGFMKDNATPFFSLRYQGHMLWDNTLPALAGYFAAMLHNPNNVSIQASTSTTPLAILVGWDPDVRFSIFRRMRTLVAFDCGWVTGQYRSQLGAKGSQVPAVRGPHRIADFDSRFRQTQTCASCVGQDL